MKNEVTKAEPRMIDIIPPGQQMDAAARINYFHTLSKQAGEVAVKAALYAGMELFKAKIDHPGAFDAWVDQNCAFGRRTAYNYLSLLTETVGKGVDLVGLAEGTDDARTDAIAEYAGNMESKGLTELYVDLGIVKKSKSNLGGKREGAGRPRKQSAEELAKQAEEVANALTAEAMPHTCSRLSTEQGPAITAKPPPPMLTLPTDMTLSSGWESLPASLYGAVTALTDSTKSRLLI